MCHIFSATSCITIEFHWYPTYTFFVSTVLAECWIKDYMQLEVRRSDQNLHKNLCISPSRLSLYFFLCRFPFSALPLYVSVYYSLLPKPTSILVLPSISLSCIYFRPFLSSKLFPPGNKQAGYTISLAPHNLTWPDCTAGKAELMGYDIYRRKN
jgi:hypothetical protein